jgi:hypothetical protein
MIPVLRSFRAKFESRNAQVGSSELPEVTITLKIHNLCCECHLTERLLNFESAENCDEVLIIARLQYVPVITST